MWPHVVSRALHFAALLSFVWASLQWEAPLRGSCSASLIPFFPCRFWILYRAYHDGHTFIVSWVPPSMLWLKCSTCMTLAATLLQASVLGRSAQANRSCFCYQLIPAMSGLCLCCSMAILPTLPSRRAC